MENNENEFNEEVINEEAIDAELCPVGETSVIDVSEEPEESGSGVGSLVLGAAVAGAVGFVAYKALPKVKAFGKRFKNKHDERKRQKTIEYAVKHGLATEINEATVAALAETDDEDDFDVDEDA